MSYYGIIALFRAEKCYFSHFSAHNLKQQPVKNTIFRNCIPNFRIVHPVETVHAPSLQFFLAPSLQFFLAPSLHRIHILGFIHLPIVTHYF